MDTVKAPSSGEKLLTIGEPVSKPLHRACIVLLVLLTVMLLGEAAALAYIKFLRPRYAPAAAPRYHVVLVGDCVVYNIAPYLRRRLGPDYLVSRSGMFVDSTSAGREIAWALYQKPDILYVSVGFGDIVRARDPVLDFQKNIERFLQALKTTGYSVRIIWGTVNLVVDDQTAQALAGTQYVGPRNKEVQAYNKATAELMKQHGIELVDMAGVFRDDTARYLHRDGYHPNKRGLEAMGKRLAEAVKGGPRQRPEGL